MSLRPHIKILLKTTMQTNQKASKSHLLYISSYTWQGPPPLPLSTAPSGPTIPYGSKCTIFGVMSRKDLFMVHAQGWPAAMVGRAEQAGNL